MLIPLPGGAEFDTTIAPNETSIVGVTEQPITLHVPQALSRLIEFWKSKPNLRGLLADYTAEAQEIENMFWDVIITRSLDYAGTDQLDHLGAIVGEPRNGRNNANYRLRIRVRIRINNSLGRAQDVIAVVRMLTSARFYFRRFPVAWFRLDFTEPLDDAELVAELPSLVEQTAALGTGVLLAFITEPVGAGGGARYGWSGNDAYNRHGYGWSSDPTVGGRYGYSVIL